MAGTAYTSFAVGDPNINAVMLNLAGINTGYNALTLTQMSTTTVPAIAAGSKIEVGGTLFKFDANEAISGSPSDGTVYIMLVPSGSSITAQFTNTAPTWSDSKQGWYGTGGSAGNRYLPVVVIKSGSVYSKYVLLLPKDLTSYAGATGNGFIIPSNIAATGVLSVAGLPLNGSGAYIGFNTEGNGVKCYTFSGTATSGNPSTATFAHGISNAMTSSRILAAVGAYKWSNVWYTGGTYTPMVSWDDTNISITIYAVAAFPVKITVLYIW